MSLPSIDFDGVPRTLDLLPPPPLEEIDLPRYGEALGADPVQPLWGKIEVELAIKDQGQTQACGGYSASYMAEGMHQVRSGGDKVRLSPTYLWSKLNQGRNQGVILAQLFQAALRYGVAPYEAFPENCYFQGQGAPDADRQAARFRFEQGHLLTGVQDLIDAISRRMFCVIGIPVGANFAQVDADGVSPPLSRPQGGHALMASGLFLSPRYGPCLTGPNSWGSRFGLQGYYAVPLDPTCGYFRGRIDAFCAMSLVPDPLTDGQPVS